MKLLIALDREHHVLGMDDKNLEKIKQELPNESIVIATTKEDVEKEIIDAEALLTSPDLYPGIVNAEKLKWIHTLSAGVDSFITEDLKKSNIILSNSSGTHIIPMGEYAIAVMLTFEKGLNHTVRNQTKKNWNKTYFTGELRNKTIGIIGMGRIGTEIAKLSKAMGMNVLATRRENTEKPEFVSELFINDTDSLLEKSDYVISVLPGTKENTKIINENTFKKMKNTARFISMGRGTVVDEAALINALQNKEIAGAGMDVFEAEPLPESSPLWEMENVIITPHNSSWSSNYMTRMTEIFLKNLKAFVNNEELPNLVDKERGY